MRVALIAPPFESVPPKLYGGTERVVYNLCRGLNAAGIEVVLYASGDSRIDVPLVPVVDEALRLSKRCIADSVPYHLRMLSLVARDAADFDVIHNHHDYWMLPLSCMTDVPVLTTLHGRMDLHDSKVGFRSFAGNSFVSISDAQRLPVPDLNWVSTIYHGINADDFQFQPKPGTYLAFLGRISVEKRPDLAIELAKRSGVPLKIAAKIEGKEGQDYYDAVIRPQVDGKFIEYIGEISESEKSLFLGQALALAFPIDWPEPFGLVMIESLACGTPVLGRPCGSVPELMQNGVTGFVDLSIANLASRVRDLPKIDRRRCREWVEQKFSLKRMTEDYIDVYRRLTRDFRDSRDAKKRQRPDPHRRNFLHSLQRPADGNPED